MEGQEDQKKRQWAREASLRLQQETLPERSEQERLKPFSEGRNGLRRSNRSAALKVESDFRKQLKMELDESSDDPDMPGLAEMDCDTDSDSESDSLEPDSEAWEELKLEDPPPTIKKKKRKLKRRKRKKKKKKRQKTLEKPPEQKNPPKSGKTVKSKRTRRQEEEWTFASQSKRRRKRKQAAKQTGRKRGRKKQEWEPIDPAQLRNEVAEFQANARARSTNYGYYCYAEYWAKAVGQEDWTPSLKCYHIPNAKK